MQTAFKSYCYLLLVGLEFCEALTKCGKSKAKPPSVSEIGKRFNVTVKECNETEIKLSHIFQPELDNTFLKVLLISLCSVATVTFEKIKSTSSTTRHLVSFIIAYSCGEIILWIPGVNQRTRAIFKYFTNCGGSSFCHSCTVPNCGSSQQIILTIICSTSSCKV